MKTESNLLTRPVGWPLQVYLDSSDYSVLSEAMLDAKHNKAGIFETLCKHVDRGDIEIRFSSVHVIEIAHLDSRSRELALRRAECLQRLSGGKCFRYWLEIPAYECINLLTNQPVFENVASNNNYWHPDLSDTALSLRELLIDEFRKIATESTPNRQQRRNLERRYFKKGYLSNEGVEILKNGRVQLLAALSQQFPFGERFFQDDLMLKFCTGEVRASDVIEEIGVVFRDIEKFIGWTYDTRDKERKLVSWLRDYGSDLISRVEAMRTQLGVTTQDGKTLSDSRKMVRDLVEAQISKLRASRLKDIRADIQKRFPQCNCTDSEWKQVEISSLGSIPSLDCYIACFCEYFRRNLQMNRTPRASDAGDLFHLAHLPYCDLFRSDGDAAETAKPVALKYNSVVVPKLRQLPKQIENALQSLNAKS